MAPFFLVEAGKAVEKHKAGRFAFASAGVHFYTPTFQVVSEPGVHRLRAHRRVGNFHLAAPIANSGVIAAK